MKNSKNKMIMCIFIVALLIVSSYKTDGQSFEYGLRLMPTFSTFNLRTSDGITIKGDATFGLGTGAFLGFNISDNVGIQGEVIYNSISQKYTVSDVEQKIILRYINIPILFSLNTGKSKPVNMNLVAGPQIGISAGDHLTTTGGEGTKTAVLSVKKGDLGIAYGAGLDFGLDQANTVRLGIGFRGVLGMFNISDNSKTIPTDSYYILDNSQIKTYSAYIGLSFLF